MIAYMQGSVLHLDEESVILNVRGVGYELVISSTTAAVLRDLANIQLWVYTHVREDALQLFGFHVKAEKELFMNLIKINGIGPKVAMKILSGAPLETIIYMIEESDVAGLSKLPKVGKKTAEQIVLGLKGKLVLSEEQGPRVTFAARADITSALVNLGFKIQDVEKVVNQMDPATDFEAGIKRGLATLAGAV